MSYQYPAAELLSGASAIGPKIRKNFWKNLTVPKIDAHWPKPTHSTQHYLNTLPKTKATLINRGEDPFRLSDAIAYLDT